MLRATLLSLLLGAAATLLVLKLVFAPTTGTSTDPAPLNWRSGDLQLVVGSGAPRAGELHLGLSDRGMAIVDLPLEATEISNYPYLQLVLRDYPRELRMVLMWQSEATGEQWRRHHFKDWPTDSLVIPLHEMRHLQGKITALRLILLGPQGESLILRSVSLQPLSLRLQLRSIYDDWAGFAEWRRAAINSHSGADPLSPFYPTPVVALLLALCLAGYVLLLVVARGRQRFSWSVVGLIFLACWLVLDSPWQYKLLRQLDETKRQFAGLTSEEKLAAGPDGRFYRLASKARAMLEGSSPRIFVASADDYNGLRTAYYLSPTNTYWQLRGNELPHHAWMKPGDYVLMVRPSELRLQREKKRLVTQRGWKFSVEPLLHDPVGTLVRIE